MAITWANEFGTNGFGVYGDNEVYARALVKRAVADWDRVITDFNFDGDSDTLTTNALNDTYTLTINAGVLAVATRRAETSIPHFDPNGLPTDTTITMDNDGAGDGWFFDTTPLEDAEFTGIADEFQASFVDASTVGQAHQHDFYRTITHEIGHAMGIFNGIGAINQFQTLLGTFPSGEALFSFNNPGGQYAVNATFTSSGGGHLYEGPAPSSLPNLIIHHNDLMNPGRTVPAGNNPAETVRQFISDLDAMILADAYGYTVTLPSDLTDFTRVDPVTLEVTDVFSSGTAHIMLDPLTGTLLVQGLANDPFNLTQRVDDTINITQVGDDIRVHLTYTPTGQDQREFIRLIDASRVDQILVTGNGGNDTITFPGLADLVQTVDYVVSSNLDRVEEIGQSTIDGIVDIGLDVNGNVVVGSVVPGNQTTLRAAIVEANARTGAQSIYVGRGVYDLTLAGTGGTAQGDLDITSDVTIIGAGAGLTVIDAGGVGGLNDRIFEVKSSSDLDLSLLTLTGGNSTPSGGAIYAYGNSLNLDQVAIVGNHTGGSGGALYTVNTTTVVTSSVIVDNTSSGSNAGAIRTAGTADNLSIGSSVFANNTDGNSSTANGIHQVVTGTTVSLGNNRTDFSGPFADGVNGDIVVAHDPALHVVTSVGDTFDHTDNHFSLSLREAISLSNDQHQIAEEIWLPAWNFRLTLTSQNDTPNDISRNDLDVLGTLTIRGIAGGTSIQWHVASVDHVFSLVGDIQGENGFDFDVDINDFGVFTDQWGSTGSGLSADFDGDDEVDISDFGVFSDSYGSSGAVLTFEDIAFL